MEVATPTPLRARPLAVPNLLTYARIVAVPAVVACLYWQDILQGGIWLRWVALTLFIAAGITDFLDGYLARKWGEFSSFGRMLDPIADKLLISAALISLVENQLAPAWAVVIIIGREFAVTGLRSIAAADGVIISASSMGKFKMLVQVLTVALLIVSSVAGKPPVGNFGLPFPAIEFWSVPELRTAWQHLFGAGAVAASDWQVLLYTAGRAMLWLVVISSCLSMYGYFRSFYRSVVPSGRPEYAGKQSGAPVVPVVRD